ncbi:hypothetical protein OEZ85_003941 [Tetradesmus obliquus]|uniref:EamA domain-containing protein n=1 Tax=Tetradesmus obliquus TaxID=3088 RepID=A0ABY8UI61_TETOB|nr:hypothetical protein OEZ85_003941 [Tetradesmus obliquus]
MLTTAPRFVRQPSTTSSRGRQLKPLLHTPVAASASDGASSSSPAAVLLASPEQQKSAYSALTLVHSAAAGATCFVPGWAMANLFDWLPTTATAMQLVIAPGAYLWLIVACLVCLKEAAAHGRLSSDTYKRLNLGVMYQSIVFAALAIRERALLTKPSLMCCLALLGATAFVAGRVYAVSAGGFSLPTIIKSFLGNLRDLIAPKTLVSGFYSLCAALALYMFFWQFPSPGTPLFLLDEGPVAVLLKQARGGGMVLAGIVWYTLKDAADRGRLAASTFRQLNLAMAVVAVLQLAAYGYMSLAGVPLVQKLYRMLMSTGIATVLVCDFQYFFAKKKPEA